MRPITHLTTLIQALVAWLAFWLLGLPDYYQQYSPAGLGIGSVLLSVVLSLLFVTILMRVKPERRMIVAFWLSFYYTVPLALLDSWYCGVYLGHGNAYVLKYWYLTVFYVTPWLTLLPTAALLNWQQKRQSKNMP